MASSLKQCCQLLVLFSLPVFIGQCGSALPTSSLPLPSEAPSEATTTNGTTKALTSSVDAFANSFSGQALVKGLRYQTKYHTEYTAAGEETSTTDETWESCSYDVDTNTLTCACEGGGSMTQGFNDSYELTDDSFLFESDLTMTFSDCVVPSCSETVTMNGTATGNMTGSFNFITGEESFGTTFSTEAECSGITVGESNVGFEMNMTFNGVSDDYNGSFCIDETLYTFDSLAELEELTDPADACSEDFGFSE